jgi:hypothetical protein
MIESLQYEGESPQPKLIRGVSIHYRSFHYDSSHMGNSHYGNDSQNESPHHGHFNVGNSRYGNSRATVGAHIEAARQLSKAAAVGDHKKV